MRCIGRARADRPAPAFDASAIVPTCPAEDKSTGGHRIDKIARAVTAVTDGNVIAGAADARSPGAVEMVWSMPSRRPRREGTSSLVARQKFVYGARFRSDSRRVPGMHSSRHVDVVSIVARSPDAVRFRAARPRGDQRLRRDVRGRSVAFGSGGASRGHGAPFRVRHDGESRLQRPDRPGRGGIFLADDPPAGRPTSSAANSR
jgi:hypothetical protein